MRLRGRKHLIYVGTTAIDSWLTHRPFAFDLHPCEPSESRTARPTRKASAQRESSGDPVTSGRRAGTFRYWLSGACAVQLSAERRPSRIPAPGNFAEALEDRKSTRLNSSNYCAAR